MDIDPQSEKRLFDRLALNFRAVVSAGTDSEETGNDKVCLADISGGGLRFLSPNWGRYHIGQIVEVCIDLPGTGEVKASVRGVGRVVRIDTAGRPEIGNAPQNASIAVRLEVPMRLVRDK